MITLYYIKFLNPLLHLVTIPIEGVTLVIDSMVTTYFHTL